MLHSVSLSHFYPNKYETAVVGPILTNALIENTNEQVPCELTIYLEGRCSAKGYLGEERRECKVEFQFPLLFKNRLEKVFKKGNFIVKAILSPDPTDTIILQLFSDKLVKDSEVYVNYLNVDSNNKALSIDNEADCALENSELMQPFLLFLVKCSIPNQAPQESFLQPLYSMIQNSDAPHASRNAIAILNRIGYSFFRENLEGINVSGACLEGILLYGAKLDQAIMTNTYVEDACLHQASLSNAKMNGIDTGRKPSLIHDSEISNWSITPNEHHVAVCTQEGKAYIWNIEKFTREKIPLPSIKIYKSFQYPPATPKPVLIKFVKFIDDTQLILITKSGIIVLWSITQSKIIDHKPTVISDSHDPGSSEDPFNYEKNVSDIVQYMKKSLINSLKEPNFKFKLENIFSTNKSNSNDSLPLVLRYSVKDTYNKSPQDTIKSVFEIWEIKNNAITPLKKENDFVDFVDIVFHIGFYSHFSIELKSLTKIQTSTQDYQCCLSPSGWIACLAFENPGSSITLMQTLHINRSVKFLIGDSIHWCGFSHDDLWLIAVININQKYSVVRWSTALLYSIQPATDQAMEMPRPDTLFETEDVIERFDLVPDSPNCVYSTGSIIYVRDLSNHEIIYQVGIPELHDFRMISKENLLLTNGANRSILEARKVNAFVNASVQTAQGSLKVEYFTPDSQEMVMIPRDHTLLQWIMLTDDINQASQKLLSSNLLNLKTYLNLRPTAHKQNLKELCFFSPRFKYMLLVDFEMEQMCIWNIAEDREHCIFKSKNSHIAVSTHTYSLKKLFRELYGTLNMHSTGHNLKVKATLSDELLLAITGCNGRRAVIYDLRIPSNIKCVCRLRKKNEIKNIHLSKSNNDSTNFFYSINKTVVSYNYIKSKKILKFISFASIISFDVSYDTQLLISSDGRSIRLWEIKTGKELDKEDTPFPLSDLKFAPNNRFIASYSETEEVTYLWEIQESKLRLILLHPKQLGCCGANFTGVALSELNQLLFEQLQGKNGKSHHTHSNLLSKLMHKHPNS